MSSNEIILIISALVIIFESAVILNQITKIEKQDKLIDKLYIKLSNIESDLIDKNILINKYRSAYAELLKTIKTINIEKQA